MALGTIKIDKINESSASATYKVSTDDFVSNDFYVHIDKASRSIKFYLDESLTKLAYTIDDNNRDEPIKNIVGVHPRALFGAISKSLKIMALATFPDKTSYSA